MTLPAINGDSIFQSTLLQEERLFLFGYSLFIYDFNPRSYKRSDFAYSEEEINIGQFQSTLLQEERQRSSSSSTDIIDFNPRSYKRSDSKNAQYSLCISAIIIA